MSRKLLLCLPVCPIDVRQGMELARLWADIEPAFNPDVTIVIALRFDMNGDCIPVDVVPRLKIKFSEVYIIKSPLKGVGFPHGCNALEIGAYQWFVENRRSGTLQADYMLISEPDTVPLRPTWLAEIIKEAYESGAPIIGCLWTKPDGLDHINGNCMMHKDFWKQCKEIWSVPPDYGWDIYIGKRALEIGKPSRLIFQDYQLGKPHNPWRGSAYIFEAKGYGGNTNPLRGEVLHPALFHGIKTLDGIDAVRHRFHLHPRA